MKSRQLKEGKNWAEKVFQQVEDARALVLSDLSIDDFETALPEGRKKDAIGDTASITLLTGLPGSGKSLRLIQFIVTAVAKGEHVYVTNINSISVPGVTHWEDPRKWQELPAGALLVVDEAQDYFPERRGGEPAPYMRELSRVRHYGVRIVLATQQPNYLDTYLRGLVGFHEHLLRVNGKDETFIFRNNTVMDTVRKPIKTIKGQYDHEKWSLPSKYFVFYKSAEIHTMRYRMPALLKKALVTAPLALLLFGGAWFFVFRDGYKQSHANDVPATEAARVAPPTAGSSSPAPAGGNVKRGITTKDEYAQIFTPLVDGVPWTAPAYVNRPVRSDPAVFCVLGGSGTDARGDYSEDSCKCVTEQATPFLVSRETCEAYARGKTPYNPYLAPEQEHARPGVQDENEQRSPDRVAVDSQGFGDKSFRGQQARYGEMRDASIPADYEGSAIR